jgi:uncharacterized protein (TIGR00251 family)
MKISIRVKTNANENKVIKISESDFRIQTTESPVDGKANQAVIKLLAKYFNVSKSQISIIHGKSAKTKLIQIT